MLHVKNARYLNDFRLWVEFDDGTQGTVDLSDSLKGPMFEPLLDQSAFQSFYIDGTLGTIVWANGADLAPEFLKSKLTD